MKKSICAILVSAIITTSGCSIYHAPWESNPYDKAPVHKEVEVYHSGEPVVNNKATISAPVFKNENKVLENKKPVATKKATVLKEKVVTIKKPVANAIPEVSKNVITSSPVRKEVLIIPIE